MGRLRQALSSDGATSDSDVSEQSHDEYQPEYILKEMHNPQTTDGPEQKPLVDLVFVHGLGGNLRTTWKVQGTTEPWFTKPEYLGRLKDSVRCLSFGYNANRFGDVANTRIIHHANDLLRNLVLKRLDEPRRPIIFIAHSLGGLVVKRSILLCATNNDWAEIKNSTSSIIFMGTPHMGSERARDLIVVQKLASLIKLQSPIATNLTEELKSFSTAVQDINMEFTIDVHRSIELLCCYESHPQRLPSGSNEIIVPQWSAVLQGVDNIDLNCHHSGLSKFSSPTEPRFEVFWGEVERLVRKATSPPKKLTKAPTWEDEAPDQTPTPSRARHVGPSRRRPDIAQKGRKPLTASAIQSSAKEILKEVRSRIEAETRPQKESSISSIKSTDQLETIDPAEFADYVRQLRVISPENRGLDRELPHWQTCQWILTDPKFEEWKTSPQGGLLFITGSPGCGKSNLAKYIQSVMEQPSEEGGDETLVIPFYCDSLESSRANPPILDLVVRSLLSKQRTMSKTVRQKMLGMLDKATPDRQKTHAVLENDLDKRFNHLMEVVQTIVLDQHGIPACLIIDGLDQCEDNFILRLLRGFDGMFRREGSKSNLRVLVTSRIADTIRGFAFANTHIEVTPDIVEADIQRVVDEEVGRIITSRQIATIAVTSVSAVIVERSNGSFLFAASVLKELWFIKDTGANSVFTLVTSCPSTMEAIYQQDMDRLEKERLDLFRLVQILCIARRVIRISEAREILRVQNPEITENYDLVGDLTRMCQRLVKLGSEDTLELLHQTLYDYITNTYDTDLIHRAFAEICLRYLSSIDWEDQNSPYYDSKIRQKQIRLRYPLLDYASPWMGMHWRHAGATAIPNARGLWEFLSSEKGKKWLLYSTKKRKTAPPAPSSDVSRLSSAVSLGVPNEIILEKKAELSVLDIALNHDSGSDSNSERQHDGFSDTESSVSGTQIGKPPVSELEVPKPPLAVLAQWDVSYIIKELFFGALESTPRRLLQTILGAVPYLAPKPAAHSLSEFRAMINEVWDETTTVHYAAAQFGNALEVMLPYVDNIEYKDDDGSTALNLAAGSGETKGVSLLIQAGADVNHADNWNQTPLFAALHSTSVEVVEYLLKHGADPNIVDDSGVSPLELVIRKNHAEFAKVLLEYPVDFKTVVSTGQPPAFLASRLGSDAVLELLLPHVDVDEIWDGERIIHDACWRGLESVVKKLITLGANLNDAPPDTPKATPVAVAAEGGHNSVLKALVVAGARVECPVPKMSAPLHIAAARGNIEACKILVHAGCDVKAESEDERTALYVAADGDWPQVVEFLLSHGADPNKPEYDPPLVVAAEIGNLEMIEILLASRTYTDVDACNDSFQTSLGIAAHFGDLEIVSYLLDHGADPNLRSGKRVSNRPLQLASYSKREKVMIELLKRGADIFPEDPMESSPFHVACLNGLVDVVQVFLEVADNLEELINLDWGWYGTPLFQAAKGGRLEVVELLLAKGASPDYRLQSKVNNGKTLVHTAAESGNIEVLKAIMAAAKDSSLEVRDSNSRTPLYYACFKGREDMVTYLLEQGVQTDVVLSSGENYAMTIVHGGSWEILNQVLTKSPTMDIDVPRTDGRTPLFLAVVRGHKKIIRTLLERGADVNRRSKNGEFPLSEAIRYRETESLMALLGHEKTDLTQVDEYGRTVLQIAQQAGTRAMPSMVLRAAKTPEVEAFLREHQDMFGYCVNDYSRIELRHEPDWARCIEAVRKEARALLDKPKPSGPEWERLGKFCLQLSAHSFAEVALQRSVEAIETTPLFLEHQIHCRICLGLISGTRYTCKTCCNTDLCPNCVSKYPKMGFHIWTCQNHSYYLIRLPEPPRLPPKLADASSELVNFAHTRQPPLSPIEEISEDEEEEEEPFHRKRLPLPIEDAQEKPDKDGDKELFPVHSDSYDNVEVEDDGHEMTASPIEDMDIGVRPDDLQRALTNLITGDEDDDRGVKDELVSSKSFTKVEYVELTEEKLGEFLEAVLRTFTLERTPESLARWAFDIDTWKLDYDMRAQVLDDDDRAPNVIHPPRHLKYTAPESEAYEFLAPLAFWFANAPAHHILTKVPFKGYERQATRKKQQVQRILSKAIVPTRTIEGADDEVDD